MPPSTFIGASTASYATPGAVTIITALTPSNVRAGDTLLFILTAGAGAASPANLGVLPAGWSIAARIATPGARPADVLRRTVTADEPASHTITGIANASYPSVLIAYRGLDQLAPLIAVANADAVAANNFVAPASSALAFSDLYLLIAVAGVSTTFMVSFGEVKRYDQVIAGPTTIAVIDYHPEAAGALSAPARTAITNTVATGQVIGILLASTAAPVAKPLTLTTKGNLGLPSIGV